MLFDTKAQSFSCRILLRLCKELRRCSVVLKENNTFYMCECFDGKTDGPESELQKKFDTVPDGLNPQQKFTSQLVSISKQMLRSSSAFVILHSVQSWK